MLGCWQLLAVLRRNWEGRGWCRCCSEFPDPVAVNLLVLRGEMELWSDVGKPSHLPCRVMGKVDVLWVLGVSQTPKRLWLLCSECRSGCNCWLFPADPNFPQLRALGRIYFTPACKDFTWAFPFHHFQLWFGGWFFFFFFYFFPFCSFLCRRKFPVGYRAVKL